MRLGKRALPVGHIEAQPPTRASSWENPRISVLKRQEERLAIPENQLEFNKTFLDRFSAKVGHETAAGCTEWTGYADKHGYARVRVSSQRGANQELTHRAIYAYVHGPIPEGMVVMHRCDNPKCVNIKHLMLGTSDDNVQDMIAKGRHAWKVKTPWQKLSAEDAKLVRRLRAMEMTQQRIADLVGVSRPLISMLLGGKLVYAA